MTRRWSGTYHVRGLRVRALRCNLHFLPLGRVGDGRGIVLKDHLNLVRAILIVVSWAGVVAMPVTIACAVIWNLFFDAGFYHAGEARYQVDLTTGMSFAEIDRVNAGIIRFFSSDESLPQALQASGASPDVFKQKEILHMNDVRGLVRGVEGLTIIGLVVEAVVLGASLATWRAGGRTVLMRVLGIGSALTIAIVILAALTTFLGFDSLFLTFHEIAFQNTYWQLDPRTDHLIQLFPFGFWFDAMLTIAFRVFIIGAVCGIIATLAWMMERARP